MTKCELKFTKYKIQNANRVIKDSIDHVIYNIQDLNLDYISIYLGGSFGRGEGSLRKINSKWIPSNDFDFFIISKTVEKWNKLIPTLKENIKIKLKIDYIDFYVFNIEQLKIFNNNISVYDFYYGSQLLDGIEIKHKIIIKLHTDFEPIEIFKLLCNRSAGVLNKKDNDYLRYQIVKLFIAMGDSILITSGFYHHLYLERYLMFKKFSSKSEMCKIFSNKMIQNIKWCYKFKIYGSDYFNYNILNYNYFYELNKLYVYLVNKHFKIDKGNILRSYKDSIKYFNKKDNCKNTRFLRILFAQPLMLTSSKPMIDYLFLFWNEKEAYKYFPSRKSSFKLWENFCH